MNTQSTSVKNKISITTKYLLIFFVIVFISLLFPNKATFKYEFELGQTWRYDDLYAPFDFPILKTNNEIETQKNELLKEYAPAYKIDKQANQNTLKLYTDAFDTRYNQIQESQYPDLYKNSQKYKDFGLRLLQNQLKRGVIQINKEHLIQKDKLVIKIIVGNESYFETIQNLKTKDQFIGDLQDSLIITGLPDIDFLYAPISNSIRANLIYDTKINEILKNDLLSSLSTTRGKVNKGELIIGKNGIITNNIFDKLNSYKGQHQNEISTHYSHYLIFGGYFILSILVIGVFLFYLKNFIPTIFAKLNSLAFVLMWFVVYAWLIHIIEHNTQLSTYIIPFCIVPIVISTFFEDKIAIFTHVSVVLLASFLSTEGYQFIFLTILAGTVAILSDLNTRDFTKFFRSILYILAAYLIGWLGLKLIENGSFVDINFTELTVFFVNVFFTLLAFPLIPLFERLFKFTSTITLHELADMNRPLLKELGLKAPGTLQHSIQVANLSEAVATAIGADSNLVKTAALYHDIGKINNPQYYIENQTGKSPHEEIDEKQSAKIIIEHVSIGLQMAKKVGLPRSIKKIIASHHGTTRVEFFYRKYLEKMGEDNVDILNFTYPGPKPTTKEETILMLADTVEAATKSLKSPTAEELDDFVDKLIQSKVNHGQLTDSKLTFEELNTAKRIFKQLLRSIHHVRLAYPEEPKP